MFLISFSLNNWTYLCRQTYLRLVEAFSDQVWRYLCSDVGTEESLQIAQKQLHEYEGKCSVQGTDDRPGASSVQGTDDRPGASSVQDDDDGPGASSVQDDDDRFGARSVQNGDDDDDAASLSSSDDDEGLLNSDGDLDIQKLTRETKMKDIKAALFQSQRRRVLRTLKHLSKAREDLNKKAKTVIL